MYHVKAVMMFNKKRVNRVVVSLTPPRKSDHFKVKREDFNSYDVKLQNSISRTRSLAIGYALSNDFDYFCTFTFADSIVNRYDYAEVKKKLTKFFNNYRRSHPDFRYICVPELHEDGAWHFHGVIKGIPTAEFYVPPYIEKRSVKGDKFSPMITVPNTQGYIRWSKYKLGWFDCSKIKSDGAVVNYFTSYITKDLGKKCSVGSKLLLKSNNLVSPTVLFSDDFLAASDWGSLGIDFTPLYRMAYEKKNGVYRKEHEYCTQYIINPLKDGSIPGVKVLNSIFDDYYD